MKRLNYLTVVLIAAFGCSVLRGLFSTRVDHPSSSNPSLKPIDSAEGCFSTRLSGFWNFSTNSIQFHDEKCQSQMETLVQEPRMANPSATNMDESLRTQADLSNRLDGSCILLFGDSTDRQIVEDWCPKWMERYIRRKDRAIQLWSPKNLTTGRSIRDHVLAGKVWNNGGIRCSPAGKFTFGSLMHYGVAPPPLWKFAHTYEPDLPHAELMWGNSTAERVSMDIPRFFRECDEKGHRDLRVVVVQSYLWDLARQWFVHETDFPPQAMIDQWAVNASRLVHDVRAAAPNGTRVAWRFAGPLLSGHGRNTEAIERMNEAFEKEEVRTDFVADYGAILGSELILKSGPFPAHPPPLPRTSYLNLLLNAVLSRRELREKNTDT